MLMTWLGQHCSWFSTAYTASPWTGKQQSDSKKIAFVTNTILDSSIMLAILRHSLSSLPMDAARSARPFIFLDPLSLSFSPSPLSISIFLHLTLPFANSVCALCSVNEFLLFLLLYGGLKDAEQQCNKGGSTLIKYSNLLSSPFCCGNSASKINEALSDTQEAHYIYIWGWLWWNAHWMASMYYGVNFYNISCVGLFIHFLFHLSLFPSFFM